MAACTGGVAISCAAAVWRGKGEAVPCWAAITANSVGSCCWDACPGHEARACRWSLPVRCGVCCGVGLVCGCWLGLDRGCVAQLLQGQSLVTA
jgi:hypothetical protein